MYAMAAQNCCDDEDNCHGRRLEPVSSGRSSQGVRSEEGRREGFEPAVPVFAECWQDQGRTAEVPTSVEKDR